LIYVLLIKPFFASILIQNLVCREQINFNWFNFAKINTTLITIFNQFNSEMTKPIKINIVILLFNLNCLIAQQIKYNYSLWDSVPLTDLSMNIYSNDTLAEAVVLLDNGCLKVPEYSKTCILKVLHRVKLLKKSAFEDYGNHTITIRNYEKLISIRAHTINPDGLRTNVSEFYDEKLNEFVNIKKFAFPKLQEGSIIEYEYVIESENLLELYPWYFRVHNKLSSRRFSVISH
jgi:Domain of Unknown Function with PDB structure (DUF3857)